MSCPMTHQPRHSDLAVPVGHNSLLQSMPKRSLILKLQIPCGGQEFWDGPIHKRRHHEMAHTFVTLQDPSNTQNISLQSQLKLDAALDLGV